MTSAEIITSRIINEMERTNSIPWQKPWRSLSYRNAVSKKEYRGINVLMLAMFGHDEFYMTFNQVRAHGGFVKKGCKAVPIVFYNVQVDKDDATKKRFFLRYYNVFGMSDTEKVKITLPVVPKLAFEPIAEAERLVAATGAKITHGCDRAAYRPATHEIVMPARETFKSVAHYYATLFHELTHWASHEVGVKLDTSFGSDSYSKEELVAEIGSNFLTSHCGIDTTGVFDNSIAYLQNWTAQLGREPRLIISASTGAQKRFDWILSKANNTKNQESEPDNGEVIDS